MTASNFRPSEKLVLLKSGAFNTQVTGEVLGTGDGTTTTFAGNLVGNGVIDLCSIHICAPKAAGPPVEFEAFEYDGNGGLTGSDGGSGTIDQDTGAYTLTTNVAVPNTLDIVARYRHMDVRGEDIVLAEDVEFTIEAEPIDQNPAVGALSGALPAPGTPVANISMTVPMYPAPGFRQLSNYVTAFASAGATSTTFTLPPGMLNIATYTTPPDGLGAIPLTIVMRLVSDDSIIETSTVDGAGNITGDDSSTGTLDWVDGDVSITFNGGALGADVYFEVNGLQHEAANVHPFMVMSHSYEMEETADMHCHHYTLDRCNQKEAGIRVLNKSTDCTSGIEFRADRFRGAPTISGSVNERILVAIEGFGSLYSGPCDIPVVPDPGLLPEDNALTHALAECSLVAKTSKGDVTFNGRLIGEFEQRSPFSAEQLLTASGDAVLAETNLVAAADSKTEFDLKFVFERPRHFNAYEYFLNNTLVELSFTWKSRIFPERTVKYEAVAYMSGVEKEDEQDTLFLNATFKLVYGLPGESDLGRNPTRPLGRWSFCTLKNPSSAAC